MSHYLRVRHKNTTNNRSCGKKKSPVTRTSLEPSFTVLDYLQYLKSTDVTIHTRYSDHIHILVRIQASCRSRQLTEQCIQQ